jgi:membrane-associated HD superfamily phosphohydrolase
MSVLYLSILGLTSRFINMKTLVKFSSILILALALFAFVSHKTEKPTTTNEGGRIMAFRPLTLLENTNPQDLERFAHE